jgi:hypothetical protein
MEGLTVADFLNDLAANSGISIDQAKQGMGAVLTALKSKLPANEFSQVQAAVPGADDLTAAAEAGKEPASSGGVLSAVKGMASKIFGGGAGAGAALLTQLQGLGLSADQLQKFLPAVLEFLKSKLPGGVMNKVSELIPAGEEVSR